MTWPYSSSDCQCVTGIEKFIDPRPYLPQYESPDSNEIELPVWEQNRQAAEKKRQEELAAQSAQTTAEISPERILKLVVQRTILTNQEYVKLLAHQINSFYVQLDSLDEAWRNRDVSIISNMQQVDDKLWSQLSNLVNQCQYLQTSYYLDWLSAPLLQ